MVVARGVLFLFVVVVECGCSLCVVRCALFVACCLLFVDWCAPLFYCVVCRCVPLLVAVFVVGVCCC